MEKAIDSLKTEKYRSIKKAAISKGMQTLRIDGAIKVLQGLTSVAEVLRVTQEETMFDEF